MGMGLSISRSILQAHGGRLWATAKEGPGTMFHFTLPKYRKENPMRESSAVCLHLFFGPWLVHGDLRRRERSFACSWIRRILAI